MSIQYSDDNCVALVDSVTGLPITVPTFESKEHAGSFLVWATERQNLDLLELDAGELETLHQAWWNSFVNQETGDLREEAPLAEA